MFNYDPSSCYVVLGGDYYGEEEVLMAVFHTEKGARAWCQRNPDFVWSASENRYIRKDKSWGDYYRIVKKPFGDTAPFEKKVISA